LYRRLFSTCFIVLGVVDMRASILLLALLGTAIPAIGLAQDASMCTSLCTSARQECKASVPAKVDLDRSLDTGGDTKNPHALAASRGAVPSADARLRNRSENESRRIERNGMCDDTYLRCSRGCANPAASAKPSEVLTKQGLARTAKP
jgi:hypothetical protein